MKPEGRAIAVAQLLRMGHTGEQVSRMLEFTDRGGSLKEALDALRQPASPAPNDPQGRGEQGGGQGG